MVRAVSSQGRCVCKSKVMYVDDDAFNMMPFEVMCGMLKVPCITFTSGEEAISHYKATLAKKCCPKGIPLVITDINMPVIDGFEVAKQIRELDQATDGVRHRVNLLALTAHVTDKVEKDAKKVGI